MKLSAHQTRWLRQKAQRLIHSRRDQPDTPIGVLEGVVALQAQELASAWLGLRARSAGLTKAQIELACQTPGELSQTWGLRGTLHLTSAADAAWLVPLLGPTFAAAGQRRFRELGWDEARAASGFKLLRAALSEDGQLTRTEIIQLLQQAGLPWEGQAPYHLIAQAALRGWLCYGSQRDGKQTFSLFERWVGELKPLPRIQALGRLARRYLAAYAPARPEDLASWSRLKAADIRLAWAQIEGEIVQVEAAGWPAWLLKKQLAWLDEAQEVLPVVRLLPRYDTYWLGYASRDLAVDPAHARKVHPGGGIIQSVLLVDGQACGNWQLQYRKNAIQVQVEMFEQLRAELLPLVEQEAADLGRFLDSEVEVSL